MHPESESGLQFCQMPAIAARTLFGDFIEIAIACRCNRTIHFLVRCNLIRMVSVFLILSMLRLQFVFCTCGVVGHFEQTVKLSKPESCCHAECHHETDSRSAEFDPTPFQSVTRVDCNHDEPMHAHLHYSQPKADNSIRLSVNWMAAECSSQWQKSLGCQRTIEPRSSQRSPISPVAMFAQLRI